MRSWPAAQAFSPVTHACPRGPRLACRLYYLKTMMFEFHQNTYVERLKAYFFLEYVLDRLASGPLLSVCHVSRAWPGPHPAACSPGHAAVPLFRDHCSP
jgi:hypothetical protein